jgi:hypothetical protein
VHFMSFDMHSLEVMTAHNNVNFLNKNVSWLDNLFWYFISCTVIYLTFISYQLFGELWRSLMYKFYSKYPWWLIECHFSLWMSLLFLLSEISFLINLTCPKWMVLCTSSLKVLMITLTCLIMPKFYERMIRDFLWIHVSITQWIGLCW